MFHPRGHRVIVHCIEIEGISEGGIVIPEEVRERHQFAMTMGYLVEAGELAWWDWGEGENRGKQWAKPGQRVIYAKYGGSEFTQRVGNKTLHFRILNDEDILAIDDGEPFDIDMFESLIKKVNNNKFSIKEKIGEV